MDFSQFRRLAVRVQVSSSLGLARPLLIHRRPSTLCGLPWWWWGELSGVPVTRPLISFAGAAHSRPPHLPKAPPPNTIALGGRFQDVNLWEPRSARGTCYFHRDDTIGLNNTKTMTQ